MYTFRHCPNQVLDISYLIVIIGLLFCHKVMHYLVSGNEVFFQLYLSQLFCVDLPVTISIKKCERFLKIKKWIPHESILEFQGILLWERNGWLCRNWIEATSLSHEDWGGNPNLETFKIRGSESTIRTQRPSHVTSNNNKVNTSLVRLISGWGHGVVDERLELFQEVVGGGI